MLKEIIYRVKVTILSMETWKLAGIPGIVGLIVAILFWDISRNYFPGLLSSGYSTLSVIFFFFMGGLSGVIIILRKEYPSVLVQIRGIPAVIFGALWVLLFWGFALMFTVGWLFN